MGRTALGHRMVRHFRRLMIKAIAHPRASNLFASAHNLQRCTTHAAIRVDGIVACTIAKSHARLHFLAFLE